MAPSKDPSPEPQSSDSTADLAQAYRDLARGEQAATALEANLNQLESRLDALLAAIDSAEDEGDAGGKGKGPGAPGAKTEKDGGGSSAKPSS